ncbi:LptA/OstA family protein [Rhodoplanes azumiensis]|uniref:LptA/OstA family protein n=1 Tax=Rhodoplanes azumiensis TaxID=1897628 RepID=A0ABW5AQ96_9BRAD
MTRRPHGRSLTRALRISLAAAAFVAASAAATLTTTMLAAAPAAAQAGGSNTPNALQGFAQNRDQPVKIESASLEVRDKEKTATFAGDVHLVQGDVTLKCRTLVVFYEPDAGKQDQKGDAKPAAKPAPAPANSAMAGGGGSQQIKRIEARGNVVVTQKDQVAIGDNGIFDMKSNTVTLLGNVVISQGPNAVKGDRLVVDMTTGVSRVECGKPGGQCRVQAVLMPGSQPSAGGATGAAAAPAPSPGGRDAAREPSRQRPGPSGLY